MPPDPVRPHRSGRPLTPLCYKLHNCPMRTAGIREVRQNLSSLIEDVRKGREILITDRGRPVARLVPATAEAALPFPDLAAFRDTMPTLQPPLSETVNEDRSDRI